jgi:hypothetical protein
MNEHALVLSAQPRHLPRGLVHGVVEVRVGAVVVDRPYADVLDAVGGRDRIGADPAQRHHRVDGCGAFSELPTANRVAPWSQVAIVEDPASEIVIEG